MERKNTLLLTIIAVATLLVAVVGATFAYFTATGAASAASEVTVTTTSVDAITSTVGNVAMEVTLADMQQANGSSDPGNLVYKDAFGNITIEIEPADTDERTCTYDIVYTTTQPFTNSTTNTTNLNEFTISATGMHNSTNNAGTIAETSLSGVTGQINLASDLSFTFTGGATQTLDWDFEVRFYNLAIDQSSRAGFTYGGEIKIDNIECVIN